jgi:type II secretory pathway component HofQ
MTLRNDARTLRILSDNEHADVSLEVKPNFDVPHDPVTGEVKAEPATPQKREYKKKAAAPAPAPVIEVEAEDTPTGTSFDDELDAQMDALLGAH